MTQYLLQDVIRHEGDSAQCLAAIKNCLVLSKTTLGLEGDSRFVPGPGIALISTRLPALARSCSVADDVGRISAGRSPATWAVSE